MPTTPYTWPVNGAGTYDEKKITAARLNSHTSAITELQSAGGWAANGNGAYTTTYGTGATGWIGVGTGASDPTDPLQVLLPNTIGKNVRISSAVTNHNHGMRLGTTATNNWYWGANTYYNGSAWAKDDTTLGGWKLTMTQSAATNIFTVDYAPPGSTTPSGYFVIRGDTGNVGIGSAYNYPNVPSEKLSVDGNVIAGIFKGKVRVTTATVPTTETSTGTAGDVAWDAAHVYLCTATNTWRKIALSNFSVKTLTGSGATYTAGDERVLAINRTEICTVTLPAAASYPGRLYTIKRISTYAHVIDPNSTETIDGASTLTLSADNQAVTIVSDGTNWLTVAKYL